MQIRICLYKYHAQTYKQYLVIMFSKLRQQRFVKQKTKSTTKRTQNRSKSPISSYTVLQKQKTNNSQLFDYQIAWICDHLYQGCFNNNLKHGEGVLILGNGAVVIGKWKKGFVEGYAIFLTPFGVKIHGHYKAGQLQGWTIVEYGDNFTIIKFINDSPQSVHFRYDQCQQSWTQAQHGSAPQHRLMSIQSITHSPNFQLPPHITDPTLLSIFSDLIMKCKTKLRPQKISFLRINDKFQYYGYTNEEKIPQGLGVIFSKDQIYSGNFQDGALNQFGLILFESGVLYKGEIKNGKIQGNGMLYNVSQDQTKIVEVNPQGVEYVIEQADGFQGDCVSFNFGKIPQMSQDRGFGRGVQYLFEQATKLYFKTKSKNDIQATNISSSENETVNNDQSQSFSEQLSEPQTRVQRRKRLKTLSFQPLLRKSSGSVKESVLPSFAVSPIFKSPTVPTQSRIPSFAPSFKQISQYTQTGFKAPQYPYLLEFQLNKNTPTTYKMARIGKIVNNSRLLQ